MAKSVVGFEIECAEKNTVNVIPLYPEPGKHLSVGTGGWVPIAMVLISSVFC